MASSEEIALFQLKMPIMRNNTASFDENVMVEFNIDTNNDNVEDLVIQAIPRDGKMYFFGPYAPSSTGF